MQADFDNSLSQEAADTRKNNELFSSMGKIWMIVVRPSIDIVRGVLPRY